MRILFLLMIFAFASLTAVAETMPKLTFSAESPQFDQATAEYREVWRSEGKKMIVAMEKVAGIKFKDKEISVIVFEGVSWSGFGDKPMKLRASYPANTKKATLIHELGHRLIVDVGIPKARSDLDEHKVLFLYLYDVWEKLYGKEFADAEVAVEKKRTEYYSKTWDWALAQTKKERAALFKELKDHTATVKPQ